MNLEENESGTINSTNNPASTGSRTENDVISRCLQIVQRFRGDGDKTTAIRDLALILFDSQGGPAALPSYIRMLDEHERDEREAQNRGHGGPDRGQAQQGVEAAGQPTRENPQRTTEDVRAERRDEDEIRTTGDPFQGETSNKSIDHPSEHHREQPEPERYAWNRAGEPALDAFKPVSLRTHELRNIYDVDIKFALHDLKKVYKKPSLPDDLWIDVLKNKFIDFGKIYASWTNLDFSADETVPVAEGVELTVRERSKTRAITDFTPWSQAFDRYTRAVVFCYPHRAEELELYRGHINEQFKNVHGQFAITLINYDTACRRLIAEDPTRCLTDFHLFGGIDKRFFSAFGIGDCSSEDSNRPRSDKRASRDRSSRRGTSSASPQCCF